MNKKNDKQSQYKDLKFSSESEFKKWLKEKTKYIVHFDSNDFDPTEWHLDERGEVLHSNLQASLWNGRMVDLTALLLLPNCSVICDGDYELKHKPTLVQQL